MSKLTTIPTATATDDLVQRPTWLPTGCPSWCEMGDLHREGDHYEDRVHFGDGVHVTASTDAPHFEGGPASVDTHMNQHYRETESRIWVGIDESSAGHYLTIDEAREYALRLLELTKIADGI